MTNSTNTDCRLPWDYITLFVLFFDTWWQVKSVVLTVWMFLCSWENRCFKYFILLIFDFSIQHPRLLLCYILLICLNSIIYEKIYFLFIQPVCGTADTHTNTKKEKSVFPVLWRRFTLLLQEKTLFSFFRKWLLVKQPWINKINQFQFNSLIDNLH